MASINVLYIEDDPEQREQFANELKERGFGVVAAASGEEGLATLGEHATDVVLCDLNMPEMDGLTVLERVQKINPDLPFIILTAHPSIPLAVQAIMQGAQRFLIKPVNMNEMEITIHQAMEFARLHRWQREAEEQLTRLVESAPVPYIITRKEDGKILYANRHLGDIIGMSPNELKGRSSLDFYFHPDERDKVLELLNTDGFVRDLEVHVRTADGTPRWMIFSLAESEIGGERVILGGLLDITRRKETADKLRLYQEIFRHSVDVIMVLDTDGRLIERNPAHEKKTGWTDEDVGGMSVFDFLDVEAQSDIRAAIERDGSYRGETIGRSKDGREVPVDISIFPIRDPNGETTRYVGMGRDITEIKRALNELAEANQELRDTQAQLVQSEKMASLGSLVAGIAHEINTPVGAMTSMQDTLMRGIEKLKEHLHTKDESFDDDKKLAAIFEVIDNSNQVIHSAGSRVSEIVRRLRSFARLDEAELKEVDIHEGLEDTLTLVHHEIKHHIDIVKHYGDIPPISVYPSRLNQVYLNLLNNARQAIEDKGTITIETRVEDGMAVIQIADDGVGVAPEIQKKIFDPGFTTKGVGVGTGLGLSICYRIIQDHHGSIEVDSKPGDGTTFTLRIPMNLEEILGVS